MPRVWKKFFSKLAAPVAIIVYAFFTVGLTGWTVENVNETTGIVVFVIMIPVPAFAFLIRDMWRDAKREVEWENRDMLDTLKGK
mgnify:CR=1 FL=1